VNKQISIQLKVLTSKMKTGLATAQQSFKKFAGGIKKALTAAAIGMAALATSAVAIGKKTIQAFSKQEDAVNDLRAALTNAGDNAGALVPKFEAFAASIQKTTKYGDEAILTAMAYGRNLGINANQMEAATKAAVGLAAKYGIDLKTAMMLVGRASQGQTQSLTRYGIVLKEGASDQEKFNQLLNIGAQSFGLAEAQAGTTAGKLQQLSNQWGDLQEQIGGLIVESGILDKAMDAVREGITTLQHGGLNKWLQTTKHNVIALADSFGDWAGLMKGRTFGESQKIREDRRADASAKKERDAKLAAIQAEKDARIKAELEVDIKKQAARGIDALNATRSALAEQQVNDETAKKKLTLLEQDKQDRIRVALEMVDVEIAAIEKVAAKKKELTEKEIAAQLKAIDKAEKARNAAADKLNRKVEQQIQQQAQLQAQVQREQDAIKEQGFAKDKANAEKAADEAQDALDALGFGEGDDDELQKRVDRIRKKKATKLSKRDQAIIDAFEARQEAQRQAKDAAANLKAIEDKRHKERLEELQKMQKKLALLGDAVDAGKKFKVNLDELKTPANRTAQSVASLDTETKAMNAKLEQLLRFS
jgi:hypothetical protein